ncbi:hypothetical protein EJ04DRAFT_93728 [Polyplosphaeria fusca]|uniref:Uncharacterized protein n=1 Tax=Polyplosphaeria fusca TaxID=682080 RepID=A0A9P4UU57_9PLEO|nr:hypothetical protein EJ04DRAFT_93728 [Polyplosphaeria fusca]
MRDVKDVRDHARLTNEIYTCRTQFLYISFSFSPLSDSSVSLLSMDTSQTKEWTRLTAQEQPQMCNHPDLEKRLQDVQGVVVSPAVEAFAQFCLLTFQVMQFPRRHRQDIGSALVSISSSITIFAPCVPLVGWANELVDGGNLAA